MKHAFLCKIMWSEYVCNRDTAFFRVSIEDGRIHVGKITFKDDIMILTRHEITNLSGELGGHAELDLDRKQGLRLIHSSIHIIMALKYIKDSVFEIRDWVSVGIHQDLCLRETERFAVDAEEGCTSLCVHDRKIIT